MDMIDTTIVKQGFFYLHITNTERLMWK